MIKSIQCTTLLCSMVCPQHRRWLVTTNKWEEIFILNIFWTEETENGAYENFCKKKIFPPPPAAPFKELPVSLERNYCKFMTYKGRHWVHWIRFQWKPLKSSSVPYERLLIKLFWSKMYSAPKFWLNFDFKFMQQQTRHELTVLSFASLQINNLRVLPIIERASPIG